MGHIRPKGPGLVFVDVMQMQDPRNAVTFMFSTADYHPMAVRREIEGESCLTVQVEAQGNLTRR